MLEEFINVLIQDSLRYFVVAGLFYLIVWVIYEKKLAHRLINGKKPNNAKIYSEIRYSIGTIVIIAIIGVGNKWAFEAGYFEMYFDIEERGWLYFLFSIGIMILFHDTYFYWTHRAMHHPWLFKKVHKVHHLSHNPSPWAAYSFHPIEATINTLFLPAIFIILPVHLTAIIVVLIFMILRNVWGHLGYELLPKGFITNKLFNWNNSTTHHHLHHNHPNSNFGLYFTWWDDLMGTTNKNYKDKFLEVTSEKIDRQANLKSWAQRFP